MRAGDLDRRLVIRRFTGAKDAFGQPARTPLDFANVACHRHTVSDGERVRAQQQGGSLTDRFTIRWSDTVRDVAVTDQLVCEGRTYAVLAVKEIGRREWLEITAQAKA